MFWNEGKLLHNCNRWREPYTAEKRNGVQVFLPQGGKQK